MMEISKKINDTNASYRSVYAGDAKNTDLFLDKEHRAFFGNNAVSIRVKVFKENLAKAILFIASILPRKYDCSSVHKKISYSREFVLNELCKLEGFFGNFSSKEIEWHIRQGVEQKNGKIDDRFYLNNLIQEYSYTDINGVEQNAKFTIRDYLAGGFSELVFKKTEENEIYEVLVENSNQGIITLEEDFVYETQEQFFNRIVFGAPGTGKSFLLNEAAKQFDSQRVKTDKKALLQASVENAISKPGKLNLLNSIGYQYADYLKNIAKKDFPSICGYEKISELYSGSFAKDIANSIIADDKQSSDINFIKELLHNDEKKGNNDLLKWANAIGFKFGDFLKDWSLDDLHKTFELSRPQASWLYRGAQASQILPTENKIEVKFVERLTFNPNYSYAQFVGTYKPIQDDEDEKQIVYEYVPGPFMRIYVRAKRALQNGSNEKFLLVIEEINRANVAAVFGDVFQLLDRKNGESEYPISASEDIKRFLSDNGIKDCNELKIPSNMYIWATMNSADQGVFPMDTAFKRRWEFEYIGIDDKESEIADYEIPLQKKEDGTHEWKKWNELRHSINDRLSSIKINEDKLLGPFFISKEKLDSVKNRNEDNAESFIKSFKSKVLMYLFEDVVRMRPGDLFNSERVGRLRFSDIQNKFDEIGDGIFFKS